MRTTRTIPIDTISVSTLNVRHDLEVAGDSTLEDLAADIAAHGLLNPVLVRPVENGHELIAGQRRLLACRDLLGWTVIDAEVKELDDDQALLVSAAENFHRADISPLDKAAVVSRFRTDVEAARALRLSASTCRRYRALGNLTADLHDALSVGGGNVAVETMSTLARTFKPEEQAAVFDQINGFDARIATQILKRSGGDLSAIGDLVDQAVAGAFDRWPCGKSLATCPHAQDPAVLTRMIAEREPPFQELP